MEQGISPLVKLLNQRKVVREYIDVECSVEQLVEIPKNAVKIPTAGFSRGIEILMSIDKKKLIEESNFSSGFMGLHNINRKDIHELFQIPHFYIIAGLITAGISDKDNRDIINKGIKKKLTHYESFSK